MGNEVSTIGGALATVGTSIAAGVTLGQVDALNKAVVDTATFTAKKASKTLVRHVGESVGLGIGTAGVAIAHGITLGQIDSLDRSLNSLGKQTGNKMEVTVALTGETLINLADSTPVVGHIKGGIHHALGDSEGGDRILKAASRTSGAVLGGIAGIPGGPAGMVAGGVAGGALADGIITGIESSIHGEFKPSGQIGAWNQVANSNGDNQQMIGGIVDGLMTPVMDGVTGFTAGSYVKGKARGKGCRRKRSLLDEKIYNFNLPDIPNNLVPLLPGSIMNLTFTNNTAHVTLMDSTISFIFILKLMSMAHVKAQPYFTEVCSGFYPSYHLDDCISMLHVALAKYEVGDGIEYGMRTLSNNTIINQALREDACKETKEAMNCRVLEKKFNEKLQGINAYVRMTSSKRRMKRMSCMPSRAQITARSKLTSKIKEAMDGTGGYWEFQRSQGSHGIWKNSLHNRSVSIPKRVRGRGLEGRIIDTINGVSSNGQGG